MRIALAACLLGVGLLPGRAAAAQPNGLWITNEQNVSLEAFMSNNQLYDQLNALSRRFPDALRLEQAGSSNEGRPIWLGWVIQTNQP
ncbi:hypothetical protein [Stutzerimonas kunmingensis]|uniref:hypothetical protein n=1 Tax=Stutzerimonas kunmingensis TaxID=1211807 RepID=UPI00241D4C59|nr:hypothetical protein [Stutzerimonas kunmingensis]